MKKKLKKAKQGASISQLSDNASSNGMMQFNGPSHANGGIPIQYGGQPVEVEGGETAFVDTMGDLNVFGNMYMPGTKTKFKTIGKHIADQEQKAGKQMDKGMKLITEADPYDRFERLKFNSGMLTAKGASSKQADLTQAKEGLALLQQSMLEMDLQKFSSKAAKGWASDQDDPKKRKGPPFKRTVTKEFDRPKGNNPSWLADSSFISGSLRPQVNPNKPTYEAPPPISIPGTGTPNTQSIGVNSSAVEPIPNVATPPKGTLTGMYQGPNKGSLAQRHNNPGNMMFNGWEKQYGAVKGEPRYDKSGKLIGYFAKFPDLQSGQNAMKALLKFPKYQNKTLEEASKTWTAEGPYQNIPNNLRNKKLKDMSPEEFQTTLDVFTTGEDSKNYNWDGTSNISMTPVGSRKPGFDVGAGITPPTLDPLGNPTYPGSPYGDLERLPTAPNRPFNPVAVPPIRPNVQSSIPAGPTPTAPPASRKPQFNVAGTPWGQIIPEIAALFDEPDFVPGQRFEPNLYQPYQVSFQDRLNENQASFRAISSQVGNNPAAVSILAGQKYEADSKVLADEFRTNQGITNDITNKNVALLNDAQLKNLQLADTQFVRQSQAKSNTRQNVFNAANSISDKIQKYNLETKQYNALSSLTPQYTFDGNGNLVYLPNTQQSFTNNGGSGTTSGNDAFYQRTREEYNAAGKLNKTVVNTPSDSEKMKADYTNWNNELKKKATLSSYYKSNGFR